MREMAGYVRGGVNLAALGYKEGWRKGKGVDLTPWLSGNVTCMKREAGGLGIY